MNASVDPLDVACQSDVSACESSNTCSAPTARASSTRRSSIFSDYQARRHVYPENYMIPETTPFGRTPLFLVPISTTDRTHAPFSLLQYMTDSLRRFHLRFEIKFRGGGALVASHFTGGSGTAYPGSPLLGAPRRADRCRRRHCTRTARRGWRRDARPRAQAEDAP